jgi:thymidylate synthase (FAD)
MKISPIEVKLIDKMGSDLSVVNAARVSFEKESEWNMASRPITQEDIDNNPYPDQPIEEIYHCVLKEGDKKLISYLAKHKHFSPFNHAFLSFRVKAPLYVARQLVKHKFLPWNEVSRRYVDSEPEFYFPEVYRAKADNVKQGSQEVDSGYRMWDAQRLTKACLEEYQYRIDKGVCPEQARDCLPTNTMTEWLWSGSLGAFADMLHLRLDPHSQKESRDVAELIYAQALPLFPVSLAALLENK